MEITNDAIYRETCKRIEELLGCPEGTPEERELLTLTEAVGRYLEGQPIPSSMT